MANGNSFAASKPGGSTEKEAPIWRWMSGDTRYGA